MFVCHLKRNYLILMIDIFLLSSKTSSAYSPLYWKTLKHNILHNRSQTHFTSSLLVKLGFHTSEEIFQKLLVLPECFQKQQWLQKVLTALPNFVIAWHVMDLI